MSLWRAGDFIIKVEELVSFQPLLPKRGPSFLFVSRCMGAGLLVSSSNLIWISEHLLTYEIYWFSSKGNGGFVYSLDYSLQSKKQA